MSRITLVSSGFLAAALSVAALASASDRHGKTTVPLEESNIRFEYNSSANDLGVQVSLDGEDWRELEIRNPNGKLIFDVEGKRGLRQLGLTELFFEGAEPSLDEFPVDELLALFPEGEYRFRGRTVDGGKITGEGTLTHAIPAGPEVSAVVGSGDAVTIQWTSVTSSADGLPVRPIEIVGYQVIVGSFQLTLPATANSVTVPPEFVASLEPGVQNFEVLAIEAGGNQTITEGTFTLP